MDVIASTAFGLQIDSHNDPNNHFVRYSNEALEFTLGNIRTLMFCTYNIILKRIALILIEQTFELQSKYCTRIF